MLSKEDRLLGEILVQRGILSPGEITAAEAERSEQAPHLSLADFLIRAGLLDGTPVRSSEPHIAPTRVGEFQILREVGRGGMGIVYEAIQQPLGRRVALKLLPPAGTLSTVSSERFVREARAAARLNHPNIVTVHASGEIDGWRFIAMDLLEGPSVESLLENGSIDAERAVRIVIAIAGALQAAHDAGLVHRDVKPSNILLDANDIPKLTDFGLVHDSGAERVTVTAAVLGTPAFMSPEQARGDAPSAIHDVYSLGCVLYAMLAGRAPYEGDQPSVVLAQLIAQAPASIKYVRPDIPRALAAVCDKAMARPAEFRYSSAREFAEDLEKFLCGFRTEAERRAAQVRIRRILGIGAIAASVLGAVIGLLWMLWGGSLARIARHEHSPPAPSFLKRITASPGPEVSPSLSPDGRWLLFASEKDGDWDIYLDHIGAQRPENLTASSAVADTEPAFSPDGRLVAFRSEREGGGIFILDVASRQCKRVLDFGYHPSWSPDGRQLAVSTERVSGVGRSGRNFESEIWVLDTASGSSRVLVTKDAVQPTWSPNGERLAFWGRRNGKTAIASVGIKRGDLKECSAAGQSPRDPIWVPRRDSLIFVSRETGVSDLWEITIEEASGECGAVPQVVAQSVTETHQSPAVDRNGERLAVVNWTRRENAARVLIGDSGQFELALVTQDVRVESSPDVSPDGGWLALSVQDGPSDLVLVRTDNSDRRTLTRDNYEERTPRWSPDGQWVAFAANRTGNFEIWRMRPDGTGIERMTETEEGSALSPVWSPDGSRLVYGVRGQGILEITPSAPAPRTPRVLAPADRMKDPEAVPRAWSPDGRLLLLISRDRDATLLDLRTGEETALPGKAQGGAWTGTGELWVADGSDLKAVVPATGDSRIVATVAPRKFSASLSIDRRTGVAYTSVVENEADIWLMDLKGTDAAGAPGEQGR